MDVTVGSVWDVRVVRHSAALLMLVAACGCTVPVKQAMDRPPLVDRVDARIGLYVPARVRGYVYKDVLTEIEFGQATVSRFVQVLDAMFSSVEVLQDWPPWRALLAEGRLSGIDGVVELESVRMTITLGDDADRPDVVSVNYKACLHGPTGDIVKCRHYGSTKSNQRRPFECLDLAQCLSPQLNGAVREAVALFIEDFEGDEAVGTWYRALPAAIRE